MTAGPPPHGAGGPAGRRSGRPRGPPAPARPRAPGKPPTGAVHPRLPSRDYFVAGAGGASARGGPRPGRAHLLSLGRLPTPADPGLFVGRQEAMRLLDGAWARGKIHVVQFVADGGVGKSTVIWNWVERLRGKRFPDCVQALDWSFYSQ